MHLVKPHWSFWIVSLLALVWNLMGSMNFMMQMSPEILATYPEAAKLLVESRPVWSTIMFAVAVYGGLLAVVLLMLKKGLSVYCFIASILGVVLTNIHTVQVTEDSGLLIGSGMSFVVAAIMVWFARYCQNKNWIAKG